MCRVLPHVYKQNSELREYIEFSEVDIETKTWSTIAMRCFDNSAITLGYNPSCISPITTAWADSLVFIFGGVLFPSYKQWTHYHWLYVSL